ncbi:hypothetical protein [Litoribacter populi]|uniref:hypothetical protein n=1 Tax=Litoribacter populi TaxID=2598460 RepID=UPI00117D2BD7|nr:hypothetical protein [Litoribacter populi]
MKVLEVEFNNKKYLVGEENGISSLIISLKNFENECEISASLGSLSNNNIKHEFINRLIDLDDCFSIKITNVFDKSMLSKPEKIKDYNIDQDDFITQAKLKSYLSLKKELEEKRLI